MSFLSVFFLPYFYFVFSLDATTGIVMGPTRANIYGFVRADIRKSCLPPYDSDGNFDGDVDALWRVCVGRSTGPW